MNAAHDFQKIVTFAAAIILIALAIWGVSLRSRFMPKVLPPPPRNTRWTETTIIAATLLIVLWVQAFTYYYGGAYYEYVPNLVGLTHRSARIGWITLGVVFVFALLCAWPALRGRTLLSVTLASILALVHLYILVYPAQTIGRLLSSDALRPNAQFEIHTRTEDAEISAQIWINGVYLGTSPIKMDCDEFKARVPYWRNQPAASAATINTRTVYCPTEKREIQECNWFKIELPMPPAGPQTGYIWQNAKTRSYYARACFCGTSANARLPQSRRSYFGSANNSRFLLELQLEFSDVFQQIRPLLNQARAKDYQVGPEWHAAVNIFGELGRAALIRASADEPELLIMLDKWVQWRYGFDKTATPAVAWRVLQRICDQAGKNRAYSSNSLAGRAVELLTPSIDPEQLVDFAENVISQLRFPNSYEDFKNGAIQIGQTSGPPNNYVACVIDHAIWTLNRQLITSGNESLNLVQRRIPFALLTYLNSEENALSMAIALGGCPELDRFLLRQPYDLKVSWQQNREHVKGLGMIQVNKWLFFLASLDNANGRLFRQQHADDLFQMIDSYLGSNSDAYQYTMPDFLYFDLDLGPSCLAARYWPRFLSHPSTQKAGALFYKFRYLVRMGPAATTDMFIETWRGTRGYWGVLESGIEALRKLPLSRRKEVVNALCDYIAKDLGNVELEKRSERKIREILINCLKDLIYATPENAAPERLRQLTRDKTLCRPMTEWLIHEAPNHPVLKLLAESPDPDLRRMVLDVVPAHPTPGNRALLGRLLADSDPAIAAGARNVRADLDRLVATPPMELVCMSPDSQPH